jgi:uncharacterized membrane protein (UPF0127 family)
MHRSLGKIFLLFGWLMAMGCATSQSQCQACLSADGKPALPRVILTTQGGKEVTVLVELACTAEQRTEGLMHRRQLAPDAGMLFIFPYEEMLSFWMKNTYIPLDMIHINKENKVVGIVEDARPHDLTPRGVGALAQYVLEVNAGFSKQHGIAKGNTVQWIEIPPRCGRAD